METPSAAMDRKYEAEAELLRVKTERERLEIRLLQAKAEIEELDLAEARDEEDHRKAADLFHQSYTFADKVSEGSVKACILRLAEWHRRYPKCDIEIIFNSPGGDVISGMALFDYILMLRRAGHKVTTIALGYAASMAGILLQAGDVRVMGSEAWLLIHEGSFGAGGSAGQVEDTVEWVKKIQKRILKIFAARSKLSATQLNARWNRKDWWLDAEESLKLGLCDEIRGLEIVRADEADED